jgi:hypothetical protein
MSTENLETKSLGPLEFKDPDQGTVEAIVATLGVVDRDREIIKHGAIRDGAKVKLSAYGHDAIFGSAPVGKGVIGIEGDKAVFRGKFFLSTTRGKEAYETVKALGADSEWSFGFHVDGEEEPTEEERKGGAKRVLSKLDAFEVSPVIIGAGIGTGTTLVKAAKDDAVVVTDDAVVVVEANEEAAALAETERVAAEAKALEDAEAKRLADEAEQKERVAEAKAEHDRVQRSLKRLGLVA